MLKIKSVILFIFVLLNSVCFADVSRGFKWKQSDLNISFLAPPVLVFAENGQGQRTGADFTLSANANGTQGNGVDSGLSEIPLSRVWQQNDSAFDGTNYENRPDTVWNIDIYYSGPETLTLNVMGVTTGIAEVKISGLYHGKGNKPTETSINVFVNPGQLRQMTLSFTPSQKMISAQPIVANGDLLNDVKTACQLDQITSQRACEFLTKEAQLIQDALDYKHFVEGEAFTWVFLHSLGYSRPIGCQDEDHHTEVKEPALTILQEDAKTLLAQIGKNKE